MAYKTTKIECNIPNTHLASIWYLMNGMPWGTNFGISDILNKQYIGKENMPMILETENACQEIKKCALEQNCIPELQEIQYSSDGFLPIIEKAIEDILCLEDIGKWNQWLDDYAAMQEEIKQLENSAYYSG